MFPLNLFGIWREGGFLIFSPQKEVFGEEEGAPFRGVFSTSWGVLAPPFWWFGPTTWGCTPLKGLWGMPLFCAHFFTTGGGNTWGEVYATVSPNISVVGNRGGF